LHALANAANVASMQVHHESVSVRYAETDRMGVAHHSSYLLWFEMGRTGLLREAGHAYRDLEAAGVMLPVIEYGCRFLHGAEYDDRLVIETAVTELQSRVVAFRYRTLRADVLIAEGFTRHACVDAANHARRLPEDLREAVSRYLVSPGAAPRGAQRM
jgi:acyl-CoA thioester hydrolase